MRDIRSDLGERLKEIEAERGRLSQRLDDLVSTEQAVRALLAEEEARWARMQPSLFSVQSKATNGSKARTEVARFLLDALADGGPKTIRTLKESALRIGVAFGSKSPGRVIHFALLGMAQNGLVEMVSKGTWKLRREEE
ncbi:MAG: hypothetical protein FJ291_33375 [Planctomycetes bacterium]|nr:hypothetical protein [Planctomycetota bacterium]